MVMRLVQPVYRPGDEAGKRFDRIAQIFERHLSLSAAAPEERQAATDVIVWPETSVPFILTENPDALVRIGDVLQDGQMLFDGRRAGGKCRYAGLPPLYYNSVYTIDDKGQILGASDKVHLTPFGEYMPLRRSAARASASSADQPFPAAFPPPSEHAALNASFGIGFLSVDLLRGDLPG
jgi:apolipoprotein N-acyltransferase